ncbi:hypothetical protein GOARA_064_01460 [Gordonia araii NBRC 100433]|uniref:Uncharacterized protein n=1 Tax=Gordonia araii NBRC 100433 TaxID=1073574 RepID=G7H5L9_9ACTN|nr:DUF6676 family protein [Gordonia araii]NNG95856.1 hypothetical protein [Gordonia araii NBRC 100433]GAB11144.1 hypothetical protein GOARA_064_01460 [Gordonia araii NBRC 100433]
MSPEPSSAVPTIPYGASVPDNVDVDAIVADLKAQSVHGPAEQVPALKQVVADAKADGHDIKIVVLTSKQPKFTYYRDVALTVQPKTGGTVIVLGPDSVGSSGPEFARVVQEEAAQNLTLSDPPGAARQMVDQLTAPHMNWSVITIVLTLAVLLAAVAARFLSKRKAGAHAGAAADEQGVVSPDSADGDTVAADDGDASVTAGGPGEKASTDD